MKMCLSGSHISVIHQYTIRVHGESKQQTKIIKMTDKYSFSWDAFESSVGETFRNLSVDKDFIDVTLACDDGNFIKAHKVTVILYFIFRV